VWGRLARFVEPGLKGLGLTVAFLALPASAWAQVLTLHCRYESAYDGTKTGSKTPKSGGFSAIVHMNELPAMARIETTTSGCFDYVGGFDEQEVTGDCEGSLAGTKVKSTLTIDRINGEFLLTTLTASHTLSTRATAPWPRNCSSKPPLGPLISRALSRRSNKKLAGVRARHQGKNVSISGAVISWDWRKPRR
jgi:hypothetical protein